LLAAAIRADTFERNAAVGTDRFAVFSTASPLDRNRQQQQCYLYERNSLDFLPELEANSNKFDVVLLDGDHNYYTVKRELQNIKYITHENSIVICDDYEGRWSHHDLFYSEREGYEANELATDREFALSLRHEDELGKCGVKPAIDEFLRQEKWFSAQPVKGEPIVLCRSAETLKKFCEVT